MDAQLRDYDSFLAAKLLTAVPTGIADIPELHPDLFDFQRACVGFCLRAGRAALFLDTGLGKTFCQLEFSEHAKNHTGRPALILAPLAVAHQIVREGVARGYPAILIRDGGDVHADAINVCNYDRLDRLDRRLFGSVSLDESSILKSFAGATTRALIDAFRETPFRLCATATPAPNDHTELGNHAEFLGVLNANEMLSRWFINDTSKASQSWRLKGHSVSDFWGWVASWARMAQSPEDLGFAGSAFHLEPYRLVRHKVVCNVSVPGELFAAQVSATGMHEAKRQSAATRAGAVAKIVQAEPDEPFVVWCDTDHESDLLTKVIGGSVVEVKGSLAPEVKESRLCDFAEGRARVIVTKPKIAGFGLNWQHCARVVFAGRSFSYEAFYQAIRRCWRFGQRREVVVHLVADSVEESIGMVIDRKARQHASMKAAMAVAMRAEREDAVAARLAVYNPTHKGRLPTWM